MLDMNTPEMQAAEKRMLSMIAEKEILPRMGKPLTLDDVFTMEERLRMAYAPVVVAESIWYYVDRVLDYCRVNRISEVKKLSRAVKMVKDSYYDFLRGSIDREHLARAKEAAAAFQDKFSWQMQLTWFTVNGELLKLYPDMLYREMRSDAHCAVLLVRVLKSFCRDVDRDIERRTHVRADALNPKIGNLDAIMDGYIGGYEIDRTVLVKRCETILRFAMNTIKYEE
jgi:hypothetical protein